MTDLDRSSRAHAGVVIVGGGLAAQRACETLRRHAYEGPIRVLAAEPDRPYDRLPLSKEYLAGKADETALRFRPAGWYAEHDIELLLHRRALRLTATSATRAGARTWRRWPRSTRRAPRLKPGGFLVLVTKDMRSRGALRNLAGGTVALCEVAGLLYWQHVIALLATIRDDRLVPRPSLWQRMQVKRALARGERTHLVCHEDVLVFRKPAADETAQSEAPCSTERAEARAA